jgi:ArsR family transcriptional regulator
LQLLSFLRGQTGSEACVCDLADVVSLSQPTVSHHLKVLVEAGLLTRSRRGYWAWYTLNDEALKSLASLLP